MKEVCRINKTRPDYQWQDEGNQDDKEVELSGTPGLSCFCWDQREEFSCSTKVQFSMMNPRDLDLIHVKTWGRARAGSVFD